MTQDFDPIVIYVTYQGTPETRFDRAYYVEHHLPHVMRAWHPHGLLGNAAFFPVVGQAGTIAICECRFRDAAALDEAFGSPGNVALMADVSNFTDAAPRRSRAIAS